MWKSRDECSLSSLSNTNVLQTVHGVGRRTTADSARGSRYRPEHVVDDDVHQFQPGPDKEDDVSDVSGGDPATFQGEHFFHLMFLPRDKKPPPTTTKTDTQKYSARVIKPYSMQRSEHKSVTLRREY